MKRIGMVLLGLCVVATAWARTWTNQAGKTLEAEFVRVKGDQVYLKLDKNRQIRPLPIEQLSSEDQAYITKRQEEMAAEKAAAALADRKAKWHDNFKDAKAEADELGMPILLLYTAPEWCGYCVRMEDGLLNTKQFKAFANQNLVLLIADYSKDADKADWIDDNWDLTQKFKAGGYPTTYFITADMEKLGKLGGYNSEWGTDTYIEKMKGFISKK